MTASLEDIGQRIVDGHPVTDADAAALASSYDIVTLGMMADEVRRRHHGRRTTFLRVAHVDGDAATIPAAAREVRLRARFATLDAARAVVAAAAARCGVPVAAFSLADLADAADGDRAVVGSWLAALRGEGLRALVEAPVERIADAALVVAAADAGVPVARLTVDLHGASGVLGTVQAMRTLVANTGAAVVAPLARRTAPETTTGYADVKAVALARLLLDVAHVQVDWGLHGPKLAQVALTFGADDVDNVSAEDEVAEGRRRAPLEEIRRNIRAASLEPLERDGAFAVLE